MENYCFEVDGGREIKDRMPIYPHSLELEMDRDAAWSVFMDLANQLKDEDRKTFFISRCGEIVTPNE